MNGKTILIVEDDRDLLVVLSTRLKAHGYRVVVALDAITAMSIAVKSDPDLVILDMALPGGNGFTLLQRIRSNLSLTTTPVIVLTAQGDEFRERVLEAGADAFFPKPADNDLLLAAISSFTCKTG
ncbi:MAG: PleD family two-component system response regulator [Candidatus Krumholzibacteriia bacterium]